MRHDPRRTPPPVRSRGSFRRTADDRLPPQFRDSFLNRNRVNRALLAEAIRAQQIAASAS